MRRAARPPPLTPERREHCPLSVASFAHWAGHMPQICDSALAPPFSRMHHLLHWSRKVASWSWPNAANLSRKQKALPGVREGFHAIGRYHQDV